MTIDPLLNVRNLRVSLPTLTGPADVIRDLSFSVQPGETLGIVGESGCGKSMTALAVLGMLPEGAESQGQIAFSGHDNLLTMNDRELQRLRGNRMALIFQEPMSALNPVHTIGRQMMEPLILHLKLSREDASARAVELLDRVGLPFPEARMKQYPHQLSGGQRQRVLIAMALACDPDLLIADEPTTALDATVKNQILDLIAGLVAERNMALILISHDLAIVQKATRQMMVMYGGDVVERGPTADILAQPAHPYTIGLLGARPDPSKVLSLGGGKRPRLATIPGTVPDLQDLPAGCRFFGRCDRGDEHCSSRPALAPALNDPAHLAACVHMDRMEVSS